MTKTEILMAALACATLVGGCDYIAMQDFKRERADRAYQTAMEDYRAGRLKEALKGLQKVCRNDPMNASARFQLACLLQDSEQDYLGAICAYREYLLQHPESEKSALTRDRLVTCEKALAKSLARKFDDGGAQSAADKVASLEASLKTSEARNVKLTKDIETSMRRVKALSEEVARLKGLMSAAADVGHESPSANASLVKDAKALLDESDDAEAPSEDVKAAKALMAADEAETAEPILEQAPDAKAKRDAARRAAEQAKRNEPPHETRPATYVVQEGDTLYKIAMRFYGRKSAWSQIREANKTIISTDGRVKVGQKIVLPK